MPVSSGLRFLVELAAWITVPWWAWSSYSGVAIAVIGVLALLTGRRRIVWSIKGEPLPVDK
ncbi:MAG: DUF2568 domain-containing protein [Dehalococcoidia bacterium]|nr:DUF2568 domain-containing protein [Dehalococcoidia bacterium]